MATDVERLVVSLDATITKYERAMNKALGVTNTTMRRIEQRHATAMQKLNAGWSRAQAGIATAFASAAALRGAQQLIDTATRMENSLKVAGLAGEELSAVQDSLFRSAQRNATPLESLVTLYGRASIVQRELGVSTEQLLGFTDKVAVALRVAGTDAATASGALLQLSQALGAGTVRAEEFSSMQEGALPVLQAVAAGLEEAGGSVSKLRNLVVEGKVSSEAFFRAFEAGAYTLTDKVANAQFTLSQQFERLQNVLVVTAGKFDEASGASRRAGDSFSQLSGFIDTIGTMIDENRESVEWFVDQLFGTAPSSNSVIDKLLELSNSAGIDLGSKLGADTTAELDNLGRLADEVAAAFDRFGGSVSDTDIALGEAEQTLASFAANTAGSLGEVDAAAQDLFQQVLEGKGSAELAAEAIKALGDARPDFSVLLNQIGGVIQRIYELRAAAVAATQVDVSGMPMSYAGQEAAGPITIPPKQVSIADHPASGSGGGGAGGGSSRASQYADEVASMEKRIAALQRETALQATLNPLVNDYGFAVARLRAQIELENAAAENGLTLSADRVAQIENLSSAYALATSEAERLAAAQEATVEQFEALNDAARNALSTIIDGFLEGKDASDIFADVLKDIGSQLLNMGMNSLFGGGGGTGLFGQLFGFAKGGIAAHGKPVKTFARGGVSNTAAIFGEAGPEAAVPLPDGKRIPVDLRLPILPSASAAGGVMEMNINIDGANGDQHVIDLVQQGVMAGIKAYDGKLKPRVQGIMAQTKQSGPLGLRG